MIAWAARFSMGDATMGEGIALVEGWSRRWMIGRGEGSDGHRATIAIARRRADDILLL